MADTSDLKKRLEALEGEGKARAGKRPPLLPLIILGGMVALGALWIIFHKTPEPEQLPTGIPEEFQTVGSGFGRIDPTEPEAEPLPPITPSEPDAGNAELQAQLEAMRAEIAALSNTPPAAPVVDDEQLTALREEMARLREDTANSQSALQEQLEERAREIQRLQTDLELARLETPRAVTPSGPTVEELRLQELERRRQAEQEELQARIVSPIIAFGGSGGGNDASASEQRRLDGNTDFVRNGAAPAEVTQAQLIVNPSNTVVQGTMIQAVLETAIDSSLAGQVRAIVSEDVHAYDGSRVLIARGSRLIGRYRSGVDIAQQRITIAWDRIILPDNQTVEISAFGGDELGRSGTTGFVDSRFGARFGSAALISLIGALPTVAADSTDDATTSDVLEKIGEDLQDSTRSVMGEYLSIAPVIYVDQGSRVTVMVDRDLEIF